MDVLADDLAGSKQMVSRKILTHMTQLMTVCHIQTSTGLITQHFDRNLQSNIARSEVGALAALGELDCHL